METCNPTIMVNSEPSQLKNGLNLGSKTVEAIKVSAPKNGKLKGVHKRIPSRRISSKQSLKKAESGKQSSFQRQSSSRKNGYNVAVSSNKHIKEPKPRGNPKKKNSQVKKYEQDKQTLLIMGQLISQVQCFTNKERYFDYKIISDTISIAEWKRIWEAFKSRLRGQFREGNEEMRQCRNESNMDYWTHHFRSYPFRLDTYNKLLSHPEILDELQSLSKNHSVESGGKVNDLLELYNSEDKIIPIIEDFEEVLKKAESHEELDALDVKIWELEKELELEEEKEKEGDESKRQYKSKEGDRTVNKIMNRIYTELCEEYEKKVFNPTDVDWNPEFKLENSDQGNEKSKEKTKLLSLNSKSEFSNTDEEASKEEPINNKRKEWSNLEIINLLKGIYQYGEPKWAEIGSSYEFENKTPHDISMKWMDIRYLIMKHNKKAEEKLLKKQGYSSAFEKQFDNKNWDLLKNSENKSNVAKGKYWTKKSGKKLIDSVFNSRNGLNNIPILHNSTLNYK